MNGFPEDFMWGVSTAGHQIEGRNLSSDWYLWEKKGKVKNKDTSEVACGSWGNFDRDIEALKDLGVNSYRYSIEWARVEPRVNAFDEGVIREYRNLTQKLVEAGIKPVVTLHHFANPQWFVELGGWENGENITYFRRYVNRIVEGIGDLVSWWITINEPNVYAIMSYMFGEWPPEIRDYSRTINVMRKLIIGHCQAYDSIKSMQPEAKVGVALNMMAFEPFRKWNPADQLARLLIGRVYNCSFIDCIHGGQMVKPLGKGEKVPGIQGKQDFLGINYYTRVFVKYARPFPEISYGTGEKTDMGYEFYPQGLGRFIEKSFKRYGLPILVTENGIADSTDEKRWRYISRALTSVNKAIMKGVPVKGYMYWSLMDNFEWKEGYSMKFGMYETDFESLKLLPRSSAEKYAEVIKNNSIQ